jgi:hypothetical protein
MPEIREIQIRNLDIPPVPDWLMRPPQAIPPVVPVTQNIGTPIVNIPGCVESHPDAGKSKTLAQDDENGTMTYCDGTVPSYNPINFEPEQIIPTKPASADTKQEEKPDPPGQVELPPAANPVTAKIDCPTPAQQAKEPVGTYIEGFRKKVTEYQLIGNQCIQITEKVPLPEQIVAGLPSAGSVMTTGGIAVIATGSALMAKPLADVLLKVVKPTVKKVMKKIAKIRGKKEVFLSVAERQAEQRERNQAIRALRSALKPKG